MAYDWRRKLVAAVLDALELGAIMFLTLVAAFSAWMLLYIFFKQMGMHCQ